VKFSPNHAIWRKYDIIRIFNWVGDWDSGHGNNRDPILLSFHSEKNIPAMEKRIRQKRTFLMKNSEHPAFAPSSEYIRKFNEGYHEPSGLTKREYFIAQAMLVLKEPNHYVGKSETDESYRYWANKCIRMADELLKQLEL
jgi:hypothetical protein